MIELVVGLLSGAAGGNIAGKLMNSSMGTLGRSLTGIVGGGGLAYLLQSFGGGGDVSSAASGMANIMGIVKGVAGGGIGGAILTAILGKVMGNKG